MFSKNYYENLESSWDKMKNTDKPIYVYGMGNGCEKLLKLCSEKQIGIKGIFASDDFVRGQSFCGYDVKRLSDVENENSDFMVVLAFGTSLDNVMKQMDLISESHELIAPEMSVADESAFEKEWLMDNFSIVEKAYDFLADDKSREVFENLTAYKISGNLEYLRKIFSDEQEAYSLLKLSESEVYCDLGAYTGDTVNVFLKEVNGKYKRIYVLEPDKHNFQKCLKNSLCLDNIELYNAAAWSHDTLLSFDAGAGRQAQLSDKGAKKVCARSLDSIVGTRDCTYIKYDVEGADIPALKGSRRLIVNCRPKLCCALYHRPYDYIHIPLYINELNSGYKFFMRQFKYYPAWETNLFCI